MWKNPIRNIRTNCVLFVDKNDLVDNEEEEFCEDPKTNSDKVLDIGRNIKDAGGL